MPDIQAVLARLFELVPRDSIRSVYRGGIVDGSSLSDLDIIIVVAGDPRAVHRVSRHLGLGIDVRGVFSSSDFLSRAPYFPYASIECVYGIDESVAFADARSGPRDLLKLACLFHTGFMRSFYPLVSDARTSSLEALRALNDFAYVSELLGSIPADVSAYCDRVREARGRHPLIDSAEALLLLRQGIDMAWRVAEILNDRLKDAWSVSYPPYVSSGREWTLFVPASSEDCRLLTDRLGRLSRLCRIAYLPLGFQAIHTDDPFAREYAARNLSPYPGFLPRIKWLIKMCVAFPLYCRLWLSDIYSVFSPYEAFSVRRATETYAEGQYLIPAEAAAFEACGSGHDARILDIGCGAGRTTFALWNAGYSAVTAIDADRRLIARAKGTASPERASSFISADALDIGTLFPDGAFDILLFSYNGIDYLFPETRRSDFFRIAFAKLTRGGYLIFSSHNFLCANRAYAAMYARNLLAILSGRNYLCASHSFGRLLTYFSRPSAVVREAESHGFVIHRIVPNVSPFFPFRDPFPYYAFRKP